MFAMKTFAVIPLALLFAGPALAQQAGPEPAPAPAQEQVTPPLSSDKISTLVIYGSDPCPPSTGDEIIICAREPESERYRIPKRLRHVKESAANRSWSDRVQTLETVSRAGLPNRCSPVGSGGQTGCFDQLLQQANAEREQAATEGADVP